MRVVGRMAGAIILRIAYGYELQDVNGHDPLVDLVDAAIGQFSASTLPGAWLVDVMPILKYVPVWFPGANFQKFAKEWKECLSVMVEKPFNFTKQQMAEGVAPPSFVSNLLENEASLTADDIYNIKWAAGSLYSGGADTVCWLSFVSFRNSCSPAAVDCLRYLFIVPCHDVVPRSAEESSGKAFRRFARYVSSTAPIIG